MVDEKPEKKDTRRLILGLLQEGRLFERGIAQRLHISQPVVNKHKRKLRKQGFSESNFWGTISGGGMVPQGGVSLAENLTFISDGTSERQITISEASKCWRCHGLHFMIHPYHIEQRYYDTLKHRGGYGIPEGDWTLILYRDRIRAEQRKHSTFDHPDKYQAMQAAETSFNAMLEAAAIKYGFSYQKEGVVSIEILNGHLAKAGSAMAKAIKEYIQIRGKDGKVYFLIDASQGHLREHEYIGKQHLEMSERLEPYINDMAYNQPLTNSQLTSRMGDTVSAFESAVRAIKAVQEAIHAIEQRLNHE